MTNLLGRLSKKIHERDVDLLRQIAGLQTAAVLLESETGTLLKI